MHTQILRGLRIRHASLFDQPHRLKLELPRKLPPLHDPPPVPVKHLSRCLRNRVQATCSIGGAECQQAEDIKKAFEKADEAAYESKKRGKKTITKASQLTH